MDDPKAIRKCLECEMPAVGACWALDGSSVPFCQEHLVVHSAHCAAVVRGEARCERFDGRSLFEVELQGKLRAAAIAQLDRALVPPTSAWGFGLQYPEGATCGVCASGSHSMCNAPHPLGSALGWCTRQKGHGGPHWLCTNLDHLVDSWPQVQGIPHHPPTAEKP